MARTKQTARRLAGSKLSRKSNANVVSKKNKPKVLEEKVIEEEVLEEKVIDEYEVLKQKFYNDPTHDPRNENKRIVNGKKPYLKLVEEFGDPYNIKKVTDVTLNKPVEKETDILSVLGDPILNILLEMEYQDMINFCNTNKTYKNACNNKILWEKRIERDFPFYSVDKNKDSKILYLK